MKRPESIASNWVFNFARWVGATPFSRTGRLSKSQSIYFVFSMLWINTSLIVTRVYQSSLTQPSSDPDPFYGIKISINSSVQFIFVVASLDYILDCLIRRQKYEYALNYLTINRTNSSDKFALILGILLHFKIFLVGLHFLEVPSLHSFVYLASSLSGVNLYNYLIILQFLSCIEAVSLKLTSLASSMRQKKIHVREFYRALNVAEILGNLYKRQILFNVVQIWGFSVMYLHYSLDGLLFRNYIVCCGPIVLYNLEMILMRCITLFIMAGRSNKFYIAAEAFNNELFRLMRESTDLCKDRKLFLHVTLKKTVNFTACGFFSLGYPLVTSIIAAATTYLVILLQFSMPQN